MRDNCVNLISNIKCKYKEWNSYFKLALDGKNMNYFNVSLKPFVLHRH